MKMCQVWLWMMAGIVMSTSAGGVLTAQRIASVEGSSREAAVTVLQKPVTLSVTNMPLTGVLSTLATRASVSIQYRDDVLAPHDKPVSLNVDQVPLGVALSLLLSGTDLQAVPFAEDIVLIRRGLAATQGTGTVTGKVVHTRTRLPLVGVTITVAGSGKRVSTGSDGTFRITGVETGDQVIRARGVGFVHQAKTISIVADRTVSVDFALDPSASVLDEVVVTGTVIATRRKEIPMPMTVISGEEMEQRGITRIEELFRGEVPGVYALEEGVNSYSTEQLGGGVRSKVYARGTSSLSGGENPLKTYVDGVELLDPSYLGTIDVKSIERIEIVTGPQAATIYGSGAIGGVMQIFTKRGRAGGISDISTSARFGMLQNNFSEGLTPTHNHGVSLQGGDGPRLMYSGTLSYQYSGQWQPGLYRRQYGTSFGATNKRDRLTLGASYSATAGNQGTWRSDHSRMYGMLRLLTGGEGVYRTVNVAGSYQSSQISTSSNQTVSVNADFRMTPTWQHSATLGRSQNTFMLRPLAPTFSAANSSTVGSDTLFRIARENGQRFTWNYNTSSVLQASWVRTSLTFGLNGSQGDRARIDGWMAGLRSQSVIGMGSSSSGPYVTIPVEDQSWGGFGSIQIGIFGRLFTTTGFRVEQNPSYGNRVKFDLTPSNGLTYTIEHGAVSLKLMGSYGRATRPPSPEFREGNIQNSPMYNPSQWVSVYPNSDLRPEYSRGPQGGFELYLGNMGSLSVNHYSQTVTDLIQTIQVDSTELLYAGQDYGFWEPSFQYQNSAKIRQFGWEGTGSLNMGPLGLRGTYSWTDSRVLWVNEQWITLRAGDSFLHSPTHTGSFSVNFAHGPASIGLTTNYTGARSSQMYQLRLFQLLTAARIQMYQVRNTTPGGRNAMGGYVRWPGYTKSNLVGSYRLSPVLTFNLNVTNLGNGFNADVSDMNPTLGRQTTVGMTYRFARR